MSVNSKMTAIADAIRERTGETGLLNLDQMPAAIASIKGGGAEINAITAASLPATVTDGQIVVITDTTPSTIYVDTDEPANPVSGDVWVVVGASESGIAFSETFRNGLSGAWQYNGGWSATDGYVGANGTWEQFGRSLPAIGTPLENWTWEEIKALADSGADVTQYFAVGDEKVLALTTGDIIVAIGAFYHNTIAGTDKKAAFAFTFKNILAPGCPMNMNATNSGGWDGSVMRKTHMATVLATFPAELQSDDGIKTVEVVANKGASTVVQTSEDRLRLHSIKELGLSKTGFSANEGETYPYYSAGNRSKVTFGGAGGYYFTRSAATNNGTNFAAITPAGAIETSGATPTRPIVCAFDI